MQDLSYRELREEAEMHLSVIVRLVDKLNHLMRRFDFENLNNTPELKGVESQKLGMSDFLSHIVRDNQILELDDRTLLNILKTIDSNLHKAANVTDAEEKNGDLFGNRLYILSDESQAAVGIMIDIESRKILVEELIQKDRLQRNSTTKYVTGSILLVITLISVCGIFFGPQFTIGTEPLGNLNLPLLNVPWPVVFWSFIGSFAAMIYRFNRQPIHEFGDVIKWTLTRLVQGVVLGSAFYLILVSGLALLTGGSTEGVETGTDSKLADEVILVLTFLVGFSDRFADTVFNALIDRYSGAKHNSEG